MKKYFPLISSLGNVPFCEPRNFHSVYFGIISGPHDIYVYNRGDMDDGLYNIIRDSDINIPKPVIFSFYFANPSITEASSVDRYGNIVALIPTGNITQEKRGQFYYPVLLKDTFLNKFTTSSYDVGSGRNKHIPANMAEVLLDALLNPFKKEYSTLFPKLSEMMGLKENLGENKNRKNRAWKRFYDNSSELINNIMYAPNERSSSKKLEFSFEIVGDEDTYKDYYPISIRLSIYGKLVRKYVDIEVIDEHNNFIEPKNDSEAQDFVQFRIDKFFAEQNKTVNITYEEIQGIIKQKPFYVNIKLLTTNPSPYIGLVFDKAGVLTTKIFSSYLEYVDKLGLLKSPIRAISNLKSANIFFKFSGIYTAEIDKIKFEDKYFDNLQLLSEQRKILDELRATELLKLKRGLKINDTIYYWDKDYDSFQKVKIVSPKFSIDEIIVNQTYDLVKDISNLVCIEEAINARYFLELHCLRLKKSEILFETPTTITTTENPRDSDIIRRVRSQLMQSSLGLRRGKGYKK